MSDHPVVPRISLYPSSQEFCLSLPGITPRLSPVSAVSAGVFGNPCDCQRLLIIPAVLYALLSFEFLILRARHSSDQRGASPFSPFTLSLTPDRSECFARPPLVAHVIARSLRVQWSTASRFVVVQTTAIPLFTTKTH